MNTGIRDRTALVLGAGGGLGSAIARGLADEGARVAAVGRTRAKVERTAQAINADGGWASAHALDLADLDAFPALLEDVRKQHGEVEILVNNSGGPPPSEVVGVPADTWLSHFRTMVLGLVALTDLAIPPMRERGWGRIVTSTSSGVITPIPNLAVSNVLRASLMSWSKTLSREIAADGITVNTVIPGRVATERVRGLDAARAEREHRSIEDVERSSIAAIPVGRYGRPEEYAAAVVFLASEAASYITGSTLRVDGGLIPAI